MSKPSRIPSSRFFSPSTISSHPSKSSDEQYAKSSKVFTSFSPRATIILRERSSTSSKSSAIPSTLQRSSSSLFSLFKKSAALACISSAVSSSKPAILEISFKSTNANSFISVNPSVTNNCESNSSTSRASINKFVLSWNSFCLLSDSWSSVRISISHPHKLEANLTFCPLRPIANDSCSSGTTTSSLCSPS